MERFYSYNPGSRTGHTTSKWTPGFFTGRMPFLSPNQQCQSTEGKTYDSCDIYKQMTLTIDKYTKTYTLNTDSWLWFGRILLLVFVELAYSSPPPRSIHVRPGPPKVSQRKPKWIARVRIFTGRMLFLSPNQQCLNTEGIWLTTVRYAKQYI